MKRILTVVAATVASHFAWAAYEIVGNYTWTYEINDDGEAVICGVDGSAAISPDPSGRVEIPSAFGPVYDQKIVTGIGDGAFRDCSGITSVLIPKTVASVGVDVFANCSGLMSIEVESGNPAYKSVDGLLLSYDGDTLFQGVNGVVTIPGTVKCIADWAFNGRGGLTRVTIPGSATNIGAFAFQYCSSLVEVKIGDSVASIGSYAFLGCSELTSLGMPESVQSIGEDAFYDCSESLFDTATIPGLKLVDGWAVGYTEELSGDVVIDGVRGIAQNAFYDCGAMTSVTIGDSVRSICDSAFSDCSSLARVTMEGDCPSMGDDVFAGVDTSCVVRIPEGNDTYIVEDGVWCGLTMEKPSTFRVTVNGEEVRYEVAADGKSRMATVAEGTIADAVKVSVAGVDVTKGFSCIVDGTVAKITLLNPYDVGRDGVAVAPWSENADGKTLTLNIEIVPGLYYAAACAESLAMLRRPAVNIPAKAGDVLSVERQSGAQGFYKIWVSDAPFAAE